MMKEETLILTLFCLGSLAKTILDPNDYRNYAGMRTKKKFKAAMQCHHKKNDEILKFIA